LDRGSPSVCDARGATHCPPGLWIFLGSGHPGYDGGLRPGRSFPMGLLPRVKSSPTGRIPGTASKRTRCRTAGHCRSLQVLVRALRRCRTAR